jgi:plasmid stability protein
MSASMRSRRRSRRRCCRARCRRSRGGDFYDAFAIADGVWGIAIGDVCGKGVDAAALTALARHTVRAAAHEQASPASVLEALTRAVLAESRPGQFLTAIFARLTALPRGRFELRFACGETASQTAEGCLREALVAGGGVTRDDIAVLVAQVGLATMANVEQVASTAGRTAAGESSTRGQ